jgi:CHASE3 domain sensor protein
MVGVMVAAGWWSVSSTTGTFRWVEHTHQVLYELETTLTNSIGIQSGVRGFGLTGDERYLELYDSGLLQVQHSTGHLREMVADNPAQSSRARRLASLVDEEAAVMQIRLAARRAGGLGAASVATADGRGLKVVGEIRSIVQAMQQAERELLAVRSRSAVLSAWQTMLVVGVAAVVVGALIALAIRTVRRLPQLLDGAQTA